MKIKIRKGKKKDVDAMMKLIQELATFERAPEEVINTISAMKKNGFGKKPIFKSFVAENKKKEIIGIAIFYIGYSTWKGKIIYLDDLIVTEAERKNGIGKMLFDEIVRFAKKESANQLRWHVLDWNVNAINFYKKYSATLDPTWITGKLSSEQIQNFK